LPKYSSLVGVRAKTQDQVNTTSNCLIKKRGEDEIIENSREKYQREDKNQG
jgi:hypothetical protein